MNSLARPSNQERPFAIMIALCVTLFVVLVSDQALKLLLRRRHAGRRACPGAIRERADGRGAALAAATWRAMRAVS